MTFTEQQREDLRRRLARLGMNTDDATLNDILAEMEAERAAEARVA